jgi:diacylglycerol kinase
LRYIKVFLGGKNMRKNKTFIESIKCAFDGLFFAFKSEKNFKVYLINILISLPINIFLHFSLKEFILYGMCIMGVFSSECLNTAIEKLCDFLTEEDNKKIKVVKDIAAAGVMCWGAAFYATEIILIGMKIFGL